MVTGGDKDTIPPEFVSSIPYNQSLNYKGTEIVLTFNERVQAPQLKRKLLITPFTDTPYKLKINKNVVQLTFDESFSDSTTYTLNFADAITDVTENNPAQKVSIAFSTWHIIDSLTIFGKIVDLMTNQPVDAAAVSVYQANDTLDIFSGKPYYFAFTDEQGQFSIQNMKGGYYRIYAFKDENSNYLNESASEAHGFIPDTLLIEDISDSLRIGLILQDVQELKFVNTRSNGNHFDVRYNKYIESYTVQTMDTLINPFLSILSEDQQSIRFYNKTFNTEDSIGYFINVSDSIGNNQLDTVYIKFTDREIKKEEFNVFISPGTRSKINEEVYVKINFNKPVLSLNKDSIWAEYDTLRSVRIDSISQSEWNWNRSSFQMTVQLEKNYLRDTLEKYKTIQDSLNLLNPIDTASVDSLEITEPPKKINPDQVSLVFGKGAFISIENDSSKSVRHDYTFRDPEKFGIISGQIEIDSIHFIVQLINDKYEIIREIANQKNYLFDFVPAGKYNIRVLVDTNNNGVWSYGNIMEGIKPEEVYFHPTFIELRENWEINEINLTIDRL